MTSAFPSDLKPDSTTGKSGGGLVDTGNSSFLTDFDKTGPGTIDTDEVDPVAEAEVYIAYGRDTQAEEILKEAMARDKGRHEIALKLLEIYHARKSATAFETVAKELHAAVGDSSPLWQKAAAMGAQIDAGNPLYAGAAASGATYAAAAPAAKPDVDFGITDTGGSAAPAPDFDLDLDTQKKSESDLPVESGGGADVDIESSTAPARGHAAAAPKGRKSPRSTSTCRPDFPSSKPAAAAPTPRAATLDPADPASTRRRWWSGGGRGHQAQAAKAYLRSATRTAREIPQKWRRSSGAKEEATKLIASLWSPRPGHAHRLGLE